MTAGRGFIAVAPGDLRRLAPAQGASPAPTCSAGPLALPLQLQARGSGLSPLPARRRCPTSSSSSCWPSCSRRRVHGGPEALSKVFEAVGLSHDVTLADASAAIGEPPWQRQPARSRARARPPARGGCGAAGADTAAERARRRRGGTGRRRATPASFTVGFIFVGPKDDFGYNQAAYEGSQAVAEAFPDLEVLTAENVPETDEADPVMEDMIAKGAKIIFATSYGHLEPAAEGRRRPPRRGRRAAGQRHQGRAVPANLGTYFGTVYEPVYLAGIAAGDGDRDRTSSATSTPSRSPRRSPTSTPSSSAPSR